MYITQCITSIRLTGFAALIFLLFIISIVPQLLFASEVVNHSLHFSNPRDHYIEVESTYTNNQDTLIAYMASWTPGSYLIRDYAKHLNSFTCRSRGKKLPVEKVSKARWQCQTQGHSQITFSYRIYSHELSVRENWLDEEFALINGAPTYIAVVGKENLPQWVTINKPSMWKRIVTPLPTRSGFKRNTYVAKDFDELIDSPILIGNPTIHRFKIDGVPHQLVNVGDESYWDSAYAAKDVQRIIEAQHYFWGTLPYQKKYIIFNIISDKKGGLEHAQSTVIMSGRWTMRNRSEYVKWLNLVSHETFHAWNAKYLKPIEFVKLDLEKEAYTTHLWFIEGLTSYYQGLISRRSGVITNEEYLKGLANRIQSLQTTPGRLQQSIADASFDAWIKYYQKNENTVNATVSYYTKGAVIGFILDAMIRKETNNSRSLDHLMRQVYTSQKPYTESDLYRLISQTANTSMNTQLDAWIHSTEALEIQSALDWYGLEMLRFEKPTIDIEIVQKAWLGFEFEKQQRDKLILKQVRTDTPAYRAGLDPGDEIIALNNIRIDSYNWQKHIDNYNKGEQIDILYARRGRLFTSTAISDARKKSKWKLSILEDLQKQQTFNLRNWLRTYL